VKFQLTEQGAKAGRYVISMWMDQPMFSPLITQRRPTSRCLPNDLPNEPVRISSFFFIRACQHGKICGAASLEDIPTVFQGLLGGAGFILHASR
jgi:hypothetical protein